MPNTPTAKKRITTTGLLGISAGNNLKLAKAVESGLKFESLERVGRMTGLQIEQLRGAVRIPPRTLARRKKLNKLSAEESDRLVTLSRLIAQAIELFEGDVKAALKWFTAANRALSGVSPLSLANSETGSREVEDLIGRLEHGVFV